MRVECPTCRVEVPENKLDFAHLLATCPKCGSTFSLTDGLVDRRLPGQSGGPRPALELPDGMTREKTAPAGGYRSSDKVGSLRLTRKTTKNARGFFGLAMLGLGGPAIAIGIMAKSTTPGSIAGGVFAAVISAIGCWAILSQLLNVTSIDVDAARIKIRTGPVPTWGENLDLVTADVAQLIVTEHRGDDSVSYSVVARQKSGQFVHVIRNVPSRAQADYIEREIEELLAIEDEDPVAALAPGRASAEGPHRVRVAEGAEEVAAGEPTEAEREQAALDEGEDVGRAADDRAYARRSSGSG